jgi:hypothetical protein
MPVLILQKIRIENQAAPAALFITKVCGTSACQMQEGRL